MFNHLKQYASVAILAMIMLASCSKDTQPGPKPGNKNVNIILDRAYLGPALMDSAIAIWQTSGRLTTVRLEQHNDTLLADAAHFPAGTGTLTVKLFSRLKFGGQYLSQWVLRRDTTMTPGKGLVIPGPSQFSDPKWSPRVELKDGIGHLAIIALRPDDPYFFVKDVPANVLEMVVARDYWRQGGGVTRIAGGEWRCSENCRNDNGHIENDQFFAFLPGQIRTKQWNHIEITVLYTLDQWGGGYVLSMTHSLATPLTSQTAHLSLQ